MRGPFLAVGGFAVEGDRLRDLERALDQCCAAAGFPLRTEFKWSPPSDNWMHSNLVGEARQAFFVAVLTAAQQHGVVAMVVAEDTTCSPAISGLTAESDALQLFMERVSNFLVTARSTGIIIADRPGGGVASENKFLLECLESLQRGTSYVQHDDLALSVVCARSDFVRCLQLADLIVSCTLARTVGSPHAIEVFDHIRPLLNRDNNRCGGIGLKIQPAHKYQNLYHWLLGDSHYWQRNTGSLLPNVWQPCYEGA